MASRISIHALLAESDRRCSSASQSRSGFLSTLSLRRATNLLLKRCRPMKFLSTLSLRRATIISIVLSILPTRFLSTLSLRRATLRVRLFFAAGRYFYPRSPCGERLDDILAGVNELLISIHALLAESDPPVDTSSVKVSISIHALLAESDRQGEFYGQS